ncbi:hypothetical protein CEUSTIGMA_g12661.t1 [Chlamydomonas eustigma]|uniref:Uncharacterized protein n=1 Tax=Chlamydomonas eustigma TaxID=1157962 RepID=A0A250XQ87_9CHLO|nr:hypothetical protein CEUSTIGMA_g12661.t1 [Chlamydomonas eustigma]|eukprot:GAX85241.1 hypothetical protein CEUSTIGMA_g12661.t1 [Chlamydomonas eustigma]
MRKQTLWNCLGQHTTFPQNFADVQPGRKTKPMERAEKEFDLDKMMSTSSTWQEIQQLVQESPHMYERNGDLSCSALLRCSQIVGRVAAVKKGAERAEIKAFVNTLALLLLPQMNKLKGPNVCSIVLSMSRLGYAHPQLTQAIFYFMAEKEQLRYEEVQPRDEDGNIMERGDYSNYGFGSDAASSPPPRRKAKSMFSIKERFALLECFARLGVRPPPETVSRALANSFPFLKFSKVEDTSSLVVALHAWRSRLSQSFADKLAFEARSQISTLKGNVLISFMSVLAAAGHKPSTYWSRELMTAFEKQLESASTSLTSPSYYPAALYALMCMRIKIPPEVFDGCASALLSSATAAKDKKLKKGSTAKAVATAAAAGAAGSEGGRRLMDALSAGEVVAVLAALGLQNKYTPEPEFVEGLLKRLQDRCSNLSAKDAAAAVALLPAVLSTPDARDDAAELVDELLAVVEGGLPLVPAVVLQSMMASLSALGHVPDSIMVTSCAAEMIGRVTAAGTAAERAAAANKSSRKRKSGAAAAPKSNTKSTKDAAAAAAAAAPLNGLGRPSLVALTVALAALPGCTNMLTANSHFETTGTVGSRSSKGLMENEHVAEGIPSATSDEIASFASALVSAGAALGGFNDAQLQSLHRSLSSLGVRMSSVRLPVVGEEDDALDEVLEGGKAGAAAAASMSAGQKELGFRDDGPGRWMKGGSSREQLEGVVPAEGEEEQQEVEHFLGYAEVEYDVFEVVEVMRAVQEDMAAAARSTAEGRDKAAARRGGKGWSEEDDQWEGGRYDAGGYEGYDDRRGARYSSRGREMRQQGKGYGYPEDDIMWDDDRSSTRQSSSEQRGAWEGGARSVEESRYGEKRSYGSRVGRDSMEGGMARGRDGRNPGMETYDWEEDGGLSSGSAAWSLQGRDTGGMQGNRKGSAGTMETYDWEEDGDLSGESWVQAAEGGQGRQQKQQQGQDFRTDRATGSRMRSLDYSNGVRKRGAASAIETYDWEEDGDLSGASYLDMPASQSASRGSKKVWGSSEMGPASAGSDDTLDTLAAAGTYDWEEFGDLSSSASFELGEEWMWKEDDKGLRAGARCRSTAQPSFGAFNGKNQLEGDAAAEGAGAGSEGLDEPLSSNMVSHREDVYYPPPPADQLVRSTKASRGHRTGSSGEVAKRTSGRGRPSSM